MQKGNANVTPTGWGFISGSRKAHFFTDNRSLCGKWGILIFMGPLEDFNHGSADNCKECKARREAINKRASHEPDKDGRPKFAPVDPNFPGIRGAKRDSRKSGIDVKGIQA